MLSDLCGRYGEPFRRGCESGDLIEDRRRGMSAAPGARASACRVDRLSAGVNEDRVVGLIAVLLSRGRRSPLFLRLRVRHRGRGKEMCVKGNASATADGVSGEGETRHKTRFPEMWPDVVPENAGYRRMAPYGRGGKRTVRRFQTYKEEMEVRY